MARKKKQKVTTAHKMMYFFAAFLLFFVWIALPELAIASIALLLLTKEYERNGIW